MLTKLTKDQIESKIDFINKYINALNPADGSPLDSNANVTQKTMATMEAEMHKDINLQVNRELIRREIATMFTPELAEQYLKDIKDHLIYVHDETSLKPYCASISLYPFLFEGTKSIGGTSKAPKNLQSFCGSFVNLVYQIASNFAGAVATVEFLMYFDYFARKTYGEDYILYNKNKVWQELQGVIYAMNQPSAARGDQSVFWNISVFDEYYFKSLFETFRFPDGSEPNWCSLSFLQEEFLDWFRCEREKELLTFPVVTVAMLIDPETKKPKDEMFEKYIAYQMSSGLSFFIYMSESADSLASCCRLRNELVDNTFSYSLGAGGVSTGSIQVITINFNRMVQKDINLANLVLRVQKYLLAHRSLQMRYLKAGLLPAYTAGYISMEKQFLTIGLNGAVEGAEYLGFDPTPNTEYINWLKYNLEIIKILNQIAYKEHGVRFNTEFVPAENLGVKNAKWDKEDGLMVTRDCYNSYFYPVEGDLSILEKLELHGHKVSDYLDGGSAVHLNLEQIPSFMQALYLIRTSASLGVPYWTFNVLSTICDKCGFIDPYTRKECKSCGNTDLDYGTRIIGYLKRVSNFSSARQAEHARRYYHKVQR